KTILFFFLTKIRTLYAAGDASGLGRQICWEATRKFGWRFLSVNFSSKKHDLGFALMTQLALAEQRFPRSHHDIASDFFALRKSYAGTRWGFTEGRNPSTPASHCDIAWAGALSSYVHAERKGSGGAVIVDDLPHTPMSEEERIRQHLLSDDTRLWTPY